ncbi:hypothetical protein ZIOFF_048317 [Zingiber officinale]|uniref:Terpene synthase metal-binding domain-containing protein n=1 Tax=Zingiber officinale TaxID=94328 RepID=A0A8J5FUW3_ZINOF|nr:hypothetical protein ZIOFF_048317 [Zingiber officinale]
MENQSLTFVGDEEAKVRKSTKFHPSIWGDYFIQNSSLSHAEESTQRMIKRVEELKVQVKSMFKDTSDILQLMNLIDSIQMLGLDYHFENEIDKALRLINEVDDKSYGLYETSLRFRLLRQHGNHVSTVISLVSIMDDIYDNYGTLEECRQLTEAIKRWKPQAIDSLPEYLKYFYLKLLKTFEEIGEELEHNEKYRMLYLQDQIKAIAVAYLEEAKWSIERHVPSLDEHLHYSLITSGCSLVPCASYVGMGEVATKEVFDWHSSFPKAVEACCAIGRILNDITSYEREQGRGDNASTVESYMKDHGTNEKDACKKLQEIVEKAWKDLNQESLNQKNISRLIIERLVNFSRSMEEIYMSNDMYTNSGTKMKGNITLVLVEAFPV